MGRNMSAARTDGFIRNIHSRNPFDVIRADVVISRLEKQAHWGCGLHYEIYEANLFDMAMNHLSRLPLKDRPVFIGAAARKGLFLTMEETRLGKRLVRTVLIFTESSDQLSRATDRVPGLPASPGYVQ